MNYTREHKQNHHSALTIGIAAIVIFFTFAVLDAGALAWSASVISGYQLAAELLTFFIVMAGAIVTVRWMRIGAGRR